MLPWTRCQNKAADRFKFLPTLTCTFLTRLAPWFFAMDHSNYARWVSAHLRDMHTLSTMNPDIAAEFRVGKFVVNKTQRAFSAIALDQTHEQLKALVKGNGGAIGLTENPAALLR